MALINPEITPASPDVVEDWEGCLSIPDIRGRVPRARQITVRAYDRRGKRIELRASGFTARVIQHETDHLDGVLFFDRMKSFESLTFLDEFGATGAVRKSKRSSRQRLSSRRAVAFLLQRPLGPQPLQLHLRVIGELHRRGDGAVAGRSAISRCICWQTRR